MNDFSNLFNINLIKSKIYYKGGVSHITGVCKRAQKETYKTKKKQSFISSLRMHKATCKLFIIAYDISFELVTIATNIYITNCRKL